MVQGLGVRGLGFRDTIRTITVVQGLGVRGLGFRDTIRVVQGLGYED